MKTNLLPTYSTTNVGMAAYLILKGHYARIETKGKKGIFNFENVPRETVINYSSGTGTVEPSSFSAKMSDLIWNVRNLTSVDDGPNDK